MHNRLPDGLLSREISLRESVVLVPLVACIVALAFYPGLITTRGEASVDRSLASLCTGVGPAITGEPLEEPSCPEGIPTDLAARFYDRGWTGYGPIAEARP